MNINHLFTIILKNLASKFDIENKELRLIFLIVQMTLFLRYSLITFYFVRT